MIQRSANEDAFRPYKVLFTSMERVFGFLEVRQLCALVLGSLIPK